MTERGLPTEGAPACPFVAFEDDRDGRSSAPDHRHRCFAEPRPAPRALAHQEAYCLSSAFPVCPTFQDWARREAASARSTSTAQPAPRAEQPQSRPLPPVDREPRATPGGTPPAAVPPRRPPQRDWAAPPPWVDDAADPGPGSTAGPSTGAGAAAGAAAAGAAGAAAGPDPAWGTPPYVAADPDPDPRQPAQGSASRGLADSAAYRLAGPDPYEPQPARAAYDDDLDAAWAAGDVDASSGAYVAGAATARPSAGTSRDLPPPRRPQPASTPSDGRGSAGRQPQVSRPPQQDASELFGPAWERPRRYEAYPSLRTRVGLPALGGIPKVAVWALVLLLAALVVFLFGPSLLGLGGDDGTGSASPTPAATEEVTAEPEPTVPPAPTPQVHVVVKGETMSKIAKKYGLTVDELLAANPQIKNPNKIKVGDEITIPVPVEDDTLGGDGTVEGESQAP